MASVKIQSQGLVLIILILAASFILIAPLIPVITFNFQLTTTTGYAVTVTNVGYQKQQLGATLSVPKGELGLNQLSAQQGTYTLLITVSYSSDKVAENTFLSVGLGTYQGKLILWPRSEQATVPYVITIILMQNQQTLAQTSASVLPA